MNDFANDSAPLVSVIIPAHNAAPFIETAIASIYRQEYAPLEIIVVDDGSTDETGMIAARYADVSVLRQHNQGPASARNLGLGVAKGEIIAFLDADDFWASAILPRLVTHLRLHPDVEIVQGLIQRMRTTWVVDGRGRKERRYEPYFTPYAYVNMGSAIFRRAVFEKVGLFNAAFIDNEDTDWMMRAWEMQVCKIVIPEIFLYYCTRADSLTAGGTRSKVALTRVLKHHRDRVRLGQVAQPAENKGGVRLHEFFGVAPVHDLTQFASDGAAS